jgi:diadenosine tetraphosphatase ApaH/serine/threonine PP2A family protein phosphatase
VHCLVIADVHANLAAFEAVLAAAPRFDEIWCLGDIVGYGPDPNECIELLRQYRHIAVAGNHDWAAIGRLDLSDFNPAARAAAEWTAEQLSLDSRRYIGSLPVQHQKEGFTAVHGSVRFPVWEYIDEPRVAWENMALMETKYCLVGHTHIPVMYVANGWRGRAREIALAGSSAALKLADKQAILNAGSVGQPRDGDPRAAYLILDTASSEAQLRRVDYAIDRTRGRMERFGLPDRNAFRLALGR